ncbi:hypothetical protein H0X06_07105 [Candidatus Dependentiae bacterium]|nr:hypothetical protein [Candidatus Dependentiae bacterium]
MNISDTLLLRKRGIIQSVGSLLKNTCNIQHSRYQNPLTLLNNVCACLIAYAFRENKPSIKRSDFHFLRSSLRYLVILQIFLFWPSSIRATGRFIKS